MELVSALDRNLILTKDESKNKKEIVTKLTNLLYEEGYINDIEQFIEDVYEREKIAPTGIGNHIAIPHGKSKTVNKPAVAVAVLNNEIEWESIDDKDVKVVVLLAASHDNQGAQDHLKLLSAVARKLGKSAVTEDLYKAKTTEDVVLALAE